MKIYIAHNRRPIVFYKNTKFRFNTASPVFSSDGATTFPFNISVEENRLALDFCEKLEISATLPGREINPLPRDFVAWSQSAVKIPVIVESKLFEFKTGYLFVTPGNLEYICTLVVGQGKFNNDVTGRLLSELCDIPVNMGSDIDDFIDAANAQITKDYPEVDFNFPIMKIDQAYTNETVNSSFKLINWYQWNIESPSFKKNDLFTNIDPGGWSPEITIASINNYTSFAPCSYVFSIIKNILNNIGFHVSGDCLNDKTINQLMFIVNKALDAIPPLDLTHLAKVGISTQREIFIYDPITRPYRFDWHLYSPAPYQNPIIGADDTDFIRIVDYNQHWHFTHTEDSVVQCHYKLILKNEWSDPLTIKIGIWKYLGAGAYSNAPILSNSENTTVPGNTLLTIEGNFNIPAYVPTSGDFPLLTLGCVYVDPPEDGWTTLRLYPGSTCDWIYISDQLLVKPITSFNLKDFLPAITLKTLLDDLMYFFGIIPFVNSDTIELTYVKDILQSSPILDLTQFLLLDYEKSNTDKILSLSLPGGFENDSLEFSIAITFPYSTIPNKIVYYPPDGHYMRNEHDEYFNFSYSRYLQDLNKIVFNVDEGSEISMSASIPEVIIVSAPVNSANKCPVPYLLNEYISPFNGREQMNVPNYLLAFWRSLQPDSLGDNYPFATPWVYKYNGGVISDSVNLKFEGDYGLYDEFLCDFIAMLNSENNVFKVEMNLPENILLTLRYNKRYTVAGIPIIIKSIDFEFDENDEIVQPVTLEIVKC